MDVTIPKKIEGFLCVINSFQVYQPSFSSHPSETSLNISEMSRRFVLSSKLMSLIKINEKSKHF